MWSKRRPGSGRRRGFEGYGGPREMRIEVEEGVALGTDKVV